MRWALCLFFLLGLGLQIANSQSGIGNRSNSWNDDRPGSWHKQSANTLSKPFSSPPADMDTNIVKRPDNILPKTIDGFHVELFASNLEAPRTLRIAPNGDLFVVESEAGRIRVFQANKKSNQNIESKIYASGLEKPYGLAFYPQGPNPQYLYVSTEKSVIRFRYANGDVSSRTAAEIIIKDLPAGGHWTRDIVFSPDSKNLFLSIGSETNVAEGSARVSQKDISDYEQKNGKGASWGFERDRALVLSFDPDGKNKRTYATGLRNCVGMAIRPNSDELWCVVNERDMLGDDLPPDYATQVKRNSFFGWAVVLHWWKSRPAAFK
ncbi:MAG: PQQ-dependent sugar dehydrogenase [Methylocystis sp.]